MPRYLELLEADEAQPRRHAFRTTTQVDTRAAISARRIFQQTGPELQQAIADRLGELSAARGA